MNFATAIANQAKSPIHIEISDITYPNLSDKWKYGDSNGNQVDMWKDGKVEWKGKEYNSKFTRWYSKLE